MTAGRFGSLRLLLIAGLFALAMGAWEWMRAPDAPATRLGGRAPDFVLPSLDGGQVSLSDLRGQVVFVNLWATWCAPCKDEAPSLERLRAAFGEQDFEILAVSIDAAEARDQVEVFRREFSLSFPILLDPNKDTYRSYGATGVPETYLIDANGRLAERFIGPRDWDQPRYARAVQRLIEAAAMAENGDG